MHIVVPSSQNNQQKRIPLGRISKCMMRVEIGFFSPISRYLALSWARVSGLLDWIFLDFLLYIIFFYSAAPVPAALCLSWPLIAAWLAASTVTEKSGGDDPGPKLGRETYKACRSSRICGVCPREPLQSRSRCEPPRRRSRCPGRCTAGRVGTSAAVSDA